MFADDSTSMITVQNVACIKATPIKLFAFNIINIK